MTDRHYDAVWGKFSVSNHAIFTCSMYSMEIWVILSFFYAKLPVKPLNFLNLNENFITCRTPHVNSSENKYIAHALKWTYGSGESESSTRRKMSAPRWVVFKTYSFVISL